MTHFNARYLPLIAGLLLCVGHWTAEHACSQDTPAPNGQAVDTDHEAERAELLRVRESLVEAILAGDIETQLQYTHPDVVTTWQDNNTANSHAGLRSFMEENLSQQDIFQGYTERPSSDVVHLYHDGTFAVAQGKSVPHYKYLGQEFDLENRWTAALTKADGDWQIVAYHVSGNIADNPLLSAAKSALYWVGGIGFLAGAIVGIIGSKLMKK